MWKLQLLAKTHHLITSVNTKLEKRSFFIMMSGLKPNLIGMMAFKFVCFFVFKLSNYLIRENV